MAVLQIKKLARSALCCLLGASLVLTSPGVGVYQALAGMEASAGKTEVRTQVRGVSIIATPISAALSWSWGRLSLSSNYSASPGLAGKAGVSQIGAGVGSPVTQALQAQSAAVRAVSATQPSAEANAPVMSAAPVVTQVITGSRPGFSLGVPQAIRATSKVVANMAQSQPMKDALSAQVGRQYSGLRNIFGEGSRRGAIPTPAAQTTFGLGAPAPRLAASAKTPETIQELNVDQAPSLPVAPADSAPNRPSSLVGRAKVWVYSLAAIAALLTSMASSALGNPPDSPMPAGGGLFADLSDISTYLSLGAIGFGAVVAAIAIITGFLGKKYRDRRLLKREISQQRAELHWYNSPQKTVVVVPSMSIDPEVIRSIVAVDHYEFRSLPAILQAKDPNIRVIFVTSQVVDPLIVEHLLGDRPDAAQIISRVSFVSLDDATPEEPLSQKLLRKRNREKLELIRSMIQQIERPAAMVPFISSQYEWDVAKALGIPLYGFHPKLAYWGTKSGSRKIFRKALKALLKAGSKTRISLIDGVEDIHSDRGLARAIWKTWRRNRLVPELVIKINDAVSGMYMATLDTKKIKAIDEGGDLLTYPVPRFLIRSSLRTGLLKLPEGVSLDNFMRKVETKGAVVEVAVFGTTPSSYPSGQGEILPDGTIKIRSTHEQRIKNKTVYKGASFPANIEYREEVQEFTQAVGQELAKLGVFGSYGVDFIVAHYEILDDRQERIYPGEINLRRGGTTHPLETAQGLTDSDYDPRSGILVRQQSETPVVYNVSDNKIRPEFVGIPYTTIMEALKGAGIFFSYATMKGVVLHIPGAITPHGKFGYTVIASNTDEAQELESRFNHLVLEIRDRLAASNQAPPSPDGTGD